MNNNSNNIPCIALVGNAPKEMHEKLNAVLEEEILTEICDVILYGADGQQEQEALMDAVEDYYDRKVDAIVCLPMATTLRKAFHNATKELSAEHNELSKEQSAECIAIHCNDTYRNANAKGVMNANEVANNLTKEDIINSATLLTKALKRDIGVLNPRIAILSLNEDIDTKDDSVEMSIIAPAVTELVNSGIQAFGPFTGKKLFEDENYKAFDAVLTMYEGQHKEEFINASNEAEATLLSGTEIPIAQADAEGLTKALFIVIDTIRNRKEYDRPFQNPLPKLYHERKEDGDKARFAVKKKGFNPAEHRRENITFTTKTNDSTPKE